MKHAPLELLGIPPPPVRAGFFAVACIPGTQVVVVTMSLPTGDPRHHLAPARAERVTRKLPELVVGLRGPTAVFESRSGIVYPLAWYTGVGYRHGYMVLPGLLRSPYALAPSASHTPTSVVPGDAVQVIRH